MTAEATFVQGDTEPPVTASITRAGGNLINGPAASVRFQMRKEDDKHYTVNAPADIVSQDDDAIAVKYTWAATDLNVPGDDYLAQWEVTYASGRVETTDPPNRITVRRQ